MADVHDHEAAVGKQERPSLLSERLGPDMLALVLGAADPATAIALASTCHRANGVLQSALGEKLREQHHATRALSSKAKTSVAALATSRRLAWSGRGLTDTDTATLAALLAAGALPELEELDLSSNSIGDRGLVALSEALSRPAVCGQLTALLLSHNAIQEEGMRALARALAREGARSRLVRLELDDNGINASALRELLGCTVAARGMQDGGGDAKGTRRQEAARLLPQLQVLDLRVNFIDDEGFAALANALCDGALPRLQTLYAIPQVGVAPGPGKGALRAACNGRRPPIFNDLESVGGACGGCVLL
jgi:hypothetical protein